MTCQPSRNESLSESISFSHQIQASNHGIKYLWCNSFFIKRSKTGPLRWHYNLSYSREVNHNIFPKTKISKRRVPWRWCYNLSFHTSREVNHNLFPKKQISKQSKRDTHAAGILTIPARESRYIDAAYFTNGSPWKQLKQRKAQDKQLKPNNCHLIHDS